MTVLDLAGVLAEGEQLSQSIAPGSVVWLEGSLGAGKTTLARAIVHGRGAGGDASSPTYGLVHHYQGPRGAVYHVDCYRLRHPDEAADLDWETLVQSDLLLVEWPERGGAWVPAATTRIQLTRFDDDRRELVVS